MVTISIEELEFYAFHGVPDEEKKVGHRYSIDLTILVDGRADETDSIGDTVDYACIGERLIGIGTSMQVNTLERLAGFMADTLLQEFEKISELTLRLTKPLPPSNMICRSASVEVHRTRS